jgi:hypothetical protein
MRTMRIIAYALWSYVLIEYDDKKGLEPATKEAAHSPRDESNRPHRINDTKKTGLRKHLLAFVVMVLFPLLVLLFVGLVMIGKL